MFHSSTSPPVVRSSFARPLRRTPFTIPKSPPTKRKLPLTARARTGCEGPSSTPVPAPGASTTRAARASKGSRLAFSVETAASDLRAVPFTDAKAPPR